jgi:tetratricopeptide (TPR) repeat protein
MSLGHPFFSALLLATVATVECLAEIAKPATAPSAPITVSEARIAVVEALKKNIGHFSGATYMVTSAELIVGLGKSVEYRCSFSSLKDFTVGTSSGFPSVSLPSREFSRGIPPVEKPFEVVWVKRNRRFADSFIEALRVLKEAASEDDFAAFIASAESWSQVTPRPEMTDDARGYKVLAEDSFKCKDFPGALAAYGKALDLHPMWSDGHYNAALLAAELEDFNLAAHHMRRYLALAPTAKDSVAAKDKLLLWQLRVKQQTGPR